MTSATERKQWIEATLRSAFEPTYLEVIDESELHRGHPGAAGGGGHFRVTVVSLRFAECSRLERHRMVYNALGDAMQSEIHALAAQTWTPQEWESRPGSGA